jgi:hypothetical protein
MVPNWKWLDDLFGPTYDLYYLDPLVLKIPLEAQKKRKGSGTTLKNAWSQVKNWRAKKELPWYTTDFVAISQLGVGIRKILGVKNPKQDLGEFTDSTLQEEFLKDYSKQNQIAQMLIGSLTKVPPGGICSTRQTRIEDLGDRLDQWRVLPNQNAAESLVVIDGVISAVEQDIRSDLYHSVIVTPEMVDRRKRVVRFCVSSLPWPLVSLESGRVGLMIDSRGTRQAYAGDTRNPIARDGWYPFAKVFGYWRTERGGRKYVDTLAILIRVWPTIDQILAAKAGGQRKLITMLNNARMEVDNARSIFDSSGVYDSRQDNVILYPVLLANLCCNLNNMDCPDFREHAPGIHEAFDNFWKNLDDFAAQINNKTESLLPGFVVRMKDKSPCIRTLFESGVA